MCLPFIFGALAVSAVPLCAHELAEEHAEHHAKGHRRHFKKPMSHSMGSAEGQSELLAGGAKGVSGKDYKDYTRRHGHRQEHANEMAQARHAADKFDNVSLPSTVRAV